MKNWKAYCLGLVTLVGLTSGLQAQLATPGNAPAAAAPAAAAAPNTLWSFLGISKAQLLACRYHLCQSQFGQLLNNGMQPISTFTGGVIPGICPMVPSAADLAKPGAAGAAAQIKKDEAEAKARRAAVRYLGTVDCHYYPDAAKALIAALRTDRNECVRWEAAHALGRGCCCTKETIAALALTVSGSDKDGNPAETSQRVKAEAEAALYHCLACYREVTPAPTGPERKPEGPVKPEKSGKDKKSPIASNTQIQPTVYYDRLQDRTMGQVVQDARLVLAQAGNTSPAGQMLPTGSHSLVQIIMNAMSAPQAPEHVMMDSMGPVIVSQGSMPALNESGQFSKPVVSPRPMVQPASAKHSALQPQNSSYHVFSWRPQANPPAPAGAAAAKSVAQLVAILQESKSPSQREAAARDLAAANWRIAPDVIPALLTAACQDAEPAVRAQCIRTLAKLDAKTSDVVTTLQILREDSDPRVQHEVHLTLAHFGADQPSGGMPTGPQVKAGRFGHSN